MKLQITEESKLPSVEYLPNIYSFSAADRHHSLEQACLFAVWLPFPKSFISSTVFAQHHDISNKVKEKTIRCLLYPFFPLINYTLNSPQHTAEVTPLT